MYFIYKISNTINQKIYIGKTTKSIETRFKRHINDAISNRLNTHLANAIRKYGKENFIIEQLDTAQTIEELNKKEIYWIGKLNTYENGYNSTLGGDGGNTYIKKTEEELKIIKEKIAKANTGSNNGMARAIKCENKKTGEILLFETNQACRNYFHSKNKSFITKRCQGILKSLYKGEWMFSYNS